MAPFTVPFPRNPQFYGREDELASLNQLFFSSQATKQKRHCIAAVHGLGGIGWRAQNRLMPIIWFNARNKGDMLSSFSSLLKLLIKGGHVPPPLYGDQGSSDVEAVRNWLALPKSTGYMLIFDSFDDLQIPIRRFLPVVLNGNVLITSRDHRVVSSGSIATFGVHLDELSPEIAARMFLQNSQSNEAKNWEIPEAHPQYALVSDIVQQLSYFPLAIDQAAAFIKENPLVTLEEYRKLLAPGIIDRQLLHSFKGLHPSCPESIITTWEISFQTLERRNPRASLILQTLGFLDNNFVPEELLLRSSTSIKWRFASNPIKRKLRSQFVFTQWLKNDAGFRTAISLLTSLSLIQRHGGPNFYLTVHPLVHEWIRIRLNSFQSKQEEFTINATLILYHFFPLEFVLRSERSFLVLDSQELHTRLDVVLNQVEACMRNLSDYGNSADPMPIECFVLVATLLLGKYLNCIILTDDCHTHLRRSLKLIEERLSSEFASTTSFITGSLTLLAQDKTEQGVPTSKLHIVKIMETASLFLDMETFTGPYLSLLLCVVFQIVNLSPPLSPTVNQYPPTTSPPREKSPAQESSSLELDKRLIHQLDRLLRQIRNPSLLTKQMITSVQLWLFLRMQPQEVHVYEYFEPFKLNLDSIAHWNYEGQAAYLTVLAKLLIDAPNPRDIGSIEKVFRVAQKIIEGKIRATHNRQTGHRWARAIDEFNLQMNSQSNNDPFSVSGSYKPLASLSDYPSFKGQNENKDIVAPMKYIWEIFMPISIAISDPISSWRVFGSQTKQSLDPAERHQGLILLTSFKALYKDACEASATPFPLNPWEFEIVKCEVLYNIHNIMGFYNLLNGIFSPRALVACCNALGKKPWLNKSTEEFSNYFDLEKSLSRIQHTLDTLNTRRRESKDKFILPTGDYLPLQLNQQIREPEVGTLFQKSYGLDDSCLIVTMEFTPSLITLLIKVSHTEGMDRSSSLRTYWSHVQKFDESTPEGQFVKWLGMLEILYYLSLDIINMMNTRNEATKYAYEPNRSQSGSDNAFSARQTETGSKSSPEDAEFLFDEVFDRTNSDSADQ